MTIERLVVPRRQVRKYAGDDWGFRGTNDFSIADDPFGELITLTPNTVSIRQTERVEGKNKHSGKAFVNWRHHQSLYFSWKGGPLRVFYKLSFRQGYGHRTTQMRDVTASGVFAMGDMLTAVRPFVLERIPGDMWNGEYERESLSTIWKRYAYPLINETGWEPHPGLAPHLRTHNIQDFTRSAFGKRAYRKDLVKFLARQKHVENVEVAYALRRLVPIEWLMKDDMITAHPDAPESLLKDMPELFGMLDMAERKRLLNDLPTARWMHIQDALRYVRQNLTYNPGWTLADFRVTTWEALHDHLPREQRRIQQPDQEIPETKITKALDGVTFDGYTVVRAQHTEELYDWGNRMSNCIGGYGQSAVSGQSNLLALMRGDNMIANIEITRDGHIRQCYGRFNARLDDELDATVRAQLSANMKGGKA